MADDLHPKRRSTLRYPGYDYSQPGCIFLTFCTHHRQHLFGSIVDGAVELSEQGSIAQDIMLQLPNRYSGLTMDSVVIMPDHIHAIEFLGSFPDRDSEQRQSLSEIVRRYKIKLQATCRVRVEDGSWPPYRSHLWQRGFHDRIIRSDRELDHLRQYVQDNPA